VVSGRLWGTGGKTDGQEVCARWVGGCVLRNLRVEMNRSDF
jgi:hypothetical protein